MKNGLIMALARARGASARIRIYSGDPKTGRAWGDVESGRVGRTTGMIKSPILVYNHRSYGGGIISSSVVKVEYANKKIGGVLYDITPEAARRYDLDHESRRLSYQYIRLADLIRAARACVLGDPPLAALPREIWLTFSGQEAGIPIEGDVTHSTPDSAKTAALRIAAESGREVHAIEHDSFYFGITPAGEEY